MNDSLKKRARERISDCGTGGAHSLCIHFHQRYNCFLDFIGIEDNICNVSLWKVFKAKQRYCLIEMDFFFLLLNVRLEITITI